MFENIFFYLKISIAERLTGITSCSIFEEICFYMFVRKYKSLYYRETLTKLALKISHQEETIKYKKTENIFFSKTNCPSK